MSHDLTREELQSIAAQLQDLLERSEQVPTIRKDGKNWRQVTEALTPLLEEWELWYDLLDVAIDKQLVEKAQGKHLAVYKNLVKVQREIQARNAQLRGQAGRTAGQRAADQRNWITDEVIRELLEERGGTRMVLIRGEWVEREPRPPSWKEVQARVESRLKRMLRNREMPPLNYLRREAVPIVEAELRETRSRVHVPHNCDWFQLPSQPTIQRRMKLMKG